jgi:hypothetical protein
MARDLLEHAELINPLFRTAMKHMPMIGEISDNYQITVNHPGFLVLDPAGGHKDVILPIEETPENVGLFYWIVNAADQAENLVIKNSGEGETVLTIGQGSIGLVFNDGTADTGWRGAVFDQTVNVSGTNASFSGTLAVTGASTFTALAKSDVGFQPNDFAITATSGGLTTGLIPIGQGFVVVANGGSTANIATLPAGAAADVGMKIRGWTVTAHELRTPASSGATINNVDSDGTQQAAIPATTYWEADLVAANTWILRAWDELGAPITAIVPDAP